MPGAIPDRHPNLPCRKILSARNRLIHGYDFVDLDILWGIVTGDLPALIPQIESVIRGERIP